MAIRHELRLAERPETVLYKIFTQYRSFQVDEFSDTRLILVPLTADNIL